MFRVRPLALVLMLEKKMSDLKKLQEQECYMEEREESKQEHN